MKRFYFLVGLLFLSIISSSQEYIKIDTVIKEFYYDYNFLQDSTDSDSEKYQEMILQVGKHCSKFRSGNLLYTDSLFYTVRHLDALAQFRKVWPRVSKLRVPTFCEYTIYKNYPHKTNIRFIGGLGSGVYLQVDEKTNFNWKLKEVPDTTILGYSCQKATCTFGGRDYEAWYTLDIPISDGPYKFGGLPGLIVRIADVENEHIFQLFKVKNCKTRKAMLYYKSDKTSTYTAQGLTKAMKIRIANLYRKIEGNPDIKCLKADGEAKALRNIRSNNNYIERYPK